ncbi:MAG: hypothetical protein NC489_22520 [Ruminococcus flavefaciens]|nr:hypothetical protein [Ruminococcus flavefaciens]
MKNRYFYVKICLFICDIVCIALSIVFFFQIMTQQRGLSETEMTVAIENLMEENTTLQERGTEMISDIQKFTLNAKELDEKIREAESRYEEVKSYYQIKLYIDSVQAQIDVENGSSEYIDRYFRIEKEELCAIVDSYDIGRPIIEGEAGMRIFVGEEMWLRYGTEVGDNLPIGLIIQNPTVDIGYQNARAGMLLKDLERILPDAEEKFLSLEYAGIYYLQYEDDSYSYYYMAIDSRDYPTILYIEPKQ